MGARERLAHLLSAEPSELLLDPTEALRLTTEAYRLWAVAAGYGQACEMFVWVNTSKRSPFQSTKHTDTKAVFLKKYILPKFCKLLLSGVKGITYHFHNIHNIFGNVIFLRIMPVFWSITVIFVSFFTLFKINRFISNKYTGHFSVCHMFLWHFFNMHLYRRNWKAIRQNLLALSERFSKFICLLVFLLCSSWQNENTATNIRNTSTLTNFPLFKHFFLNNILGFDWIPFVLTQRSVPKISQRLAVSPQTPGCLWPSAAPSAPVDPGRRVSAHAGDQHCRLPPGAAHQHGQVHVGFIQSVRCWKHPTDYFTRRPLSSQGVGCPPPPPVTWGHVSGLQASLLAHLKGFLRSLDNPVQRAGSLALIPVYLAYLHAYYHQLSRQVLLSWFWKKDLNKQAVMLGLVHNSNLTTDNW